jgi:aminopeptidase N
MDVVAQDIYLDFSGFGQQLIHAHCETELSVVQDVDSLQFDFAGLTLDSVLLNAESLPFNLGASGFWVFSNGAGFAGGDTLSFHFYYHGTPIADATWGGFYYNSQYAYNMGVGFDADPHCFGRVWHPCIDDFNDRAQYTVRVETLGEMSGYAGGVLTEESILPNGHRLNVWEMDQPVPSYLASVAVSQYVRHESDFLSLDGTSKPIWLVARASDTTDFKSSLLHLPEVLEGFETAFGPYPFDRVGYVAVPFSGGAMEHASNIAYPLFAIDGSLGYETLYVHELSHMWWGDAITCSSREDMWLNEGWASYCESLALEVLYGETAYWSEQKALHKEILTQAHVQDGGYWPVSGVPHSLTYGTTVYRKGAWVVHNLRKVMGDSAFFAACSAYQLSRSWQSHSSAQLRDFFQNYTNVDLTAFFLTHVFEPGFLGFHISNWNAYPEFAGGFLVHLTTEQHTRRTAQTAASMPLKVSVFCDDGLWYDFPILQLGSSCEHDVHVPTGPLYVVLNRGNALHHAVLGDEKWITTTGTQTLSYPEVTLLVNELSADSAWFRAENHLVGEEDSPYITGTDWYISPERFVQLYLDTTQVSLGARLNFNSTSSADWDSAFFSMLWAMNGLEDSVHLLYKRFDETEWQEYPFYVVNNMGSPSSGSGRFELSKVLPGSYTWGFHTGQVVMIEREDPEVFFDAEHFWSENPLSQVCLYNAEGKAVAKWKMVSPQQRMELPNESGVYFLHFLSNGKAQKVKWVKS